MLSLLALIAVIVVLAAVVGMSIGTIPTPIPRSMAAWFRGVFHGSMGITIWRAFLVAVFVMIGAALVLGLGMIGSFIAALILTTLLAETVRSWIMDLWNADFYTIQV